MRSGPIHWVGGEHEFALRLGQLRTLQDSCDAGPEQVFNRLRAGQWRVDDLIEPIRLGLIGSGSMSTEAAGPFVTKLFDQHPRMDFKVTAIEILARALFGVEGDPVGEPEGVTPTAPENGGSAGSTETEPF